MYDGDGDGRTHKWENSPTTAQGSEKKKWQRIVFDRNKKNGFKLEIGLDSNWNKVNKR